jgi:hypothetical protein
LHCRRGPSLQRRNYACVTISQATALTPDRQWKLVGRSLSLDDCRLLVPYLLVASLSLGDCRLLVPYLLVASLSLGDCRLLVPRDGDLAPPAVDAATAPQVSLRRQRRP